MASDFVRDFQGMFVPLSEAGRGVAQVGLQRSQLRLQQARLDADEEERKRKAMLEERQLEARENLAESMEGSKLYRDPGMAAQMVRAGMNVPAGMMRKQGGDGRRKPIGTDKWLAELSMRRLELVQGLGKEGADPEAINAQIDILDDSISQLSLARGKRQSDDNSFKKSLSGLSPDSKQAYFDAQRDIASSLFEELKGYYGDDEMARQHIEDAMAGSVDMMGLTPSEFEDISQAVLNDSDNFENMERFQRIVVESDEKTLKTMLSDPDASIFDKRTITEEISFRKKSDEIQKLGGDPPVRQDFVSDAFRKRMAARRQMIEAGKAGKPYSQVVRESLKKAEEKREKRRLGTEYNPLK